MAMQMGKSGLAAKYGGRLAEVAAKHASDETDYGFQRVPPGITNGVAKLVECKFDQYKTGPNKGEYYFRAAAVVIEPESVVHKGATVEVRGLQTSVMFPVCDTKNAEGKVTSQEEHVTDILNEMRKLGADTAFLANDPAQAAANMEALAAALKEAAPFFRFSTSERKARTPKEQDGVWENWHGTKGLEDYVPPEGSGVEDSTGVPQQPSNGQAVAPSESGQFSEMADLDSLVAQASADPPSREAMQTLKDMALKIGYAETTIDEAESWEQVKGMIEAGSPKQEEAPSSPETPPWKPEKGKVYKYQVIDPKTGKPVLDKSKKPKKPVDVEVTQIYDDGTVSLKNLQDGKSTYLQVPFDQLIQ